MMTKYEIVHFIAKKYKLLVSTRVLFSQNVVASQTLLKVSTSIHVYL